MKCAEINHRDQHKINAILIDILNKLKHTAKLEFEFISSWIIYNFRLNSRDRKIQKIILESNCI